MIDVTDEVAGRKVWVAVFDHYGYRRQVDGNWRAATVEEYRKYYRPDSQEVRQDNIYRWDDGVILDVFSDGIAVRLASGRYERVSFDRVVEPYSEAADERHNTEYVAERARRVGADR